MPELTEVEKARRAAELATILQSRGNGAPIPSSLVGTSGPTSIMQQYQDNQSGFDEQGNSNFIKNSPLFSPDVKQTIQGVKEGNPRKAVQGALGLASTPVTALAGPMTGMAVNSAGAALAESLPSNAEKGIDTSHVDLKSAFGSKEFNNLSLTDQKKTLAAGIPGLDTLTNDDYLLWREHEGFPLEGARRHSIFDTALNLARPLISGVVGAAASKIPGLGPLAQKAASVAGYTLTDAIAQHVQNNAPSSLVSQALGVEPGTLGDTLLSTAEQGTVGKVIDTVVKGLGSKLKGVINKDEVLATMGLDKQKLADFEKLQPTFSQFYQRTFGTKAKVSQVLEDTFNGITKGKLVQAAESKAVAGIKDQALRATPEVDPHLIADDVAAMAQENLHKSVQYSNSEAANVGLAAKQNSVTYTPKPPEPEMIPSSIMGQDGKPIMVPGPTRQMSPVVVEGPVRLFNSRKAIDEIEHNLEQVPQEDPQLGSMKAVLGALKGRMSQKDENGTTIPLDFKEAWELSKMYGRNGWENSRLRGDSPAPTTFMGGNYRKLWQAVTEDIKDSIPTWEQQGDKGGALSSFLKAKQAVSDRNTIFSEHGLYDLINEKGTRIPYLDEAMKDPKVLENVLQGSELKLPNGKVEMTNARRTIGGYTLNKMLESSTSDNPLTGKTQEFNSQKFYDQWSDPKFQQVKDKLFSKEAQGYVSDLIKNTSAMQQATGPGLNINAKLIGGGIALTGALASGVTHGLGYGLAISGLATGGVGMAKLLSNPTTAKILVAASKGAPLNMSQESAARMIGQVLNGLTLTAINPDGSEQDVVVQNGKMKVR